MSTERTDKHLARAIADLRGHKPDPGLWENISQNLDKRATPSKSTRTKYYLVAAAMLMLLAFGVSFVKAKPQGLSYGEELSELNVGTYVVTEEDQDFQAFLDEECAGYREVCKSPRVRVLISELTAVRSEVSSIIQMIEETGYDELLYKAKNKADEESVRIKKELVKLLRG